MNVCSLTTHTSTVRVNSAAKQSTFLTQFHSIVSYHILYSVRVQYIVYIYEDPIIRVADLSLSSRY